MLSNMKFWLHIAPWNFEVKKLYYSQHLPVFRYKCFYCIYGALIWLLYKIRRIASGLSNASQRLNCTLKANVSRETLKHAINPYDYDFITKFIFSYY